MVENKPVSLGIFHPWMVESGQITIIPKPELSGFWGYCITKPPFKVTSAEVVVICPDEIKVEALVFLLNP